MAAEHWKDVLPAGHPSPLGSHLRGRGRLCGRMNGSMWYRSASSIHRSTRCRRGSSCLQGAVGRWGRGAAADARVDMPKDFSRNYKLGPRLYRVELTLPRQPPLALLSALHYRVGHQAVQQEGAFFTE